MIVGAVILLICGICLANRPEEIIRFHVKANSDSQVDQQVKLDVRDALLAYLSPLMAEAKDVDTARQILITEIPQLKGCADRVLAEQGLHYTAQVSLGEREFPTRNYNGKEYPQGVYEALMVELGEAEGQNWWCVAYPTLCFTPLDQDTPLPQKRSLFEIIRSWFT